MSRYTKYIGNMLFTITRGREHLFKENVFQIEFAENILEVISPKYIGDNWKVMLKDCEFNHFGIDDAEWLFSELSNFIDEEIDLQLFDEEFPIVNELGYAHRLKCHNGKCKVTNLIIKEVD